MEFLRYQTGGKKRRAKNRDRKNQGFTYVEFVVATSIIVLLSIQVFSFSGLNEAASLNRTAQELGFAVRRAQSMALAVTALNIGGVLRIPPSVGIRVSSNGGENTDYFFFSDLNKNGSFQLDERVEPNLLLPNGVLIKEIILSDLSTVPIAHIIFTTPEATPLLSEGGGIDVGNQIRVVLQGRSGVTRTVKIYTSGQITITNP